LVLGVLHPERARGKEPLVEALSADAERVLHVLRGTGAESVGGNRERGDSDFAHRGIYSTLTAVWPAASSTRGSLQGQAREASADGMWLQVVEGRALAEPDAIRR